MPNHFQKAMYTFVSLACTNVITLVLLSPIIFPLALYAIHKGWKSDDVV